MFFGFDGPSLVIKSLIFQCYRTSPPQDVVHYLEREAAEGSEATTEASNRPTSVTPNLDSRFSRSISIARSEENSGSKTGGGPMISPLVPLEQLLQQEEFSGG